MHAANRTLAPHFDGVGHSFQTVQKEGQDLNFRRLQTSFTARMSRKGLVGEFGSKVLFKPTWKAVCALCFKATGLLAFRGKVA